MSGSFFRNIKVNIVRDVILKPTEHHIIKTGVF